uniref:Reverse transcriptase domain-containing protein n=1 Tax=Cannabis sativa TaxID=3483 RepID=A0A803PA04_CANSA
MTWPAKHYECIELELPRPGNQRTIQFLKEIVFQKRPDFIFLCETKCHKSKVVGLAQALNFDSVFVVDANGASGGIALLWKNKDSRSLLGYSKHHIDLQISISPTSPTWRLIGFYGEPNRNRRSDSWTLLQSLKDRSSLPWCVIGDINNIVRQEDKRGGRPYPQWLLTGFQQTLLQCGLEDIELQGHQFTWEKGRGTSAWIEVRPDRALISTSWNQLFHSATLSNLGFATSDHSPLFLEPVVVNNFAPSRRFRFENSWLKEPLCFEIIRDVWSQEHNISISNKINMFAEKLSSWGKELTGTLNHRIKSYKADLKKLHGLRDPTSVRRYAETKKKLYDAFDQRERKKNNQITQLKDDHGNWVSWESGLPIVVSNYFHELFQASGCACDEVIDCLPSAVTDLVNPELCQPIEDKEVREAVFQMHPDKSLGPDGMTSAFFQKCWTIVGEEVVKNVRSFFESGLLAEGCGDANVVVLPKTRNLECTSDLRPIALCNVLFKIITKVMVNRMKPFMDSIISENQSAFIPGRLISDNILVPFEVLHYLRRKRKAMLRNLGFVEKWIQLIMKCVKSAKYCVTHANNEVGPIIPTRGIRQGDPLSPYLFILCAEGFSALLRKYERRGWLHGCKVANGAPRVSHMLFADNSYLYCKATENEAQRIEEVLLKFELATGQKVNFSKSSIFFSVNTLSSMKDRINSILGMVTAAEDSLYLGLPSSMGRNKSATLGFLKNKVKNRLLGYGTKFLSRAGKKILIKTVAQALPSYECFLDSSRGHKRY